VGFGSTPVTWTRGVNLWFFRRRGLALGITLVGTSLTAILVPPLAANSVEHFGWRLTFPILAVLTLFRVLPIGLLLFREPRPEQRSPDLTVDGVLSGITLREAVGGYRFGLIWLSILCVATGAATDLIAFLAGRYFGMAHYGKIYGMLYLPFGLASAVSPAVYGGVRDATGTYDAMLYVAIGLFIAGAVMLLGLGRYPDLQAGRSAA